MELKGKKALITGGSRGIGKAVALAFAQNGADIVVCATNQTQLDEAVNDIKKSGVEAKGIVCDVSNYEQVSQTVLDAVDFLGGIDILANIAGISPKKEDGLKLPFWEIEPGDWDRVINVNLNSTFYFSREVAPYMMKQNYGRIINMSSIVGLTSSEHGPAAASYTTSKTGIVGLTRAIAYELAPHGITVNAVAAGRISTAMSAANNPYYNELHMKLIPMKRFGTPEEVADLFVFLASEHACYITGETTNITGGWFL